MPDDTTVGGEATPSRLNAAELADRIAADAHRYQTDRRFRQGQQG